MEPYLKALRNHCEETDGKWEHRRDLRKMGVSGRSLAKGKIGQGGQSIAARAVVAAILGCAVLLMVAKCASAEVREDQAVRAIIGEASDQGYQGMLAVACAIRNRGHLKGVYGLNAKHVDREPEWVWERARKAWRESEKIDVVFGADHWENIKAFGTPYWAKDMEKTVTVKDHSFYKGGTRKDNADDREKHGRTSRGEKHSEAIKGGLYAKRN